MPEFLNCIKGCCCPCTPTVSRSNAKTCTEYSLDRLTLFLETLISFLQNTLNGIPSVNATIYSENGRITNAVLSGSSYLINGYLITVADTGENVAVRLRNINEIVFNRAIYIGGPLSGIPLPGSITLQIPRLLPPVCCFDLEYTKTLLDSSIGTDISGNLIWNPISRLSFVDFDMTNVTLFATTDGLVIVHNGDGTSTFAPLTSVSSITASFVR